MRKWNGVEKREGVSGSTVGIRIGILTARAVCLSGDFL